MNRLTDPQILVVDSDLMSLAETRAILNDRPNDVLIASTCASARQIASQLPLDLVICSTRVEFRSGMQLLREIRSYPNCSDVPAIFGSETQRLDVRYKVDSSGGTYFLKKPFRKDVLLGFVDELLWLPAPSASPIPTPHFRAETTQARCSNSTSEKKPDSVGSDAEGTSAQLDETQPPRPVNPPFPHITIAQPGHASPSLPSSGSFF